MDYYQSPRISWEFLDCSMPMTFDQYSNCWYNCLYCFSTFQRGIWHCKENYYWNTIKHVNVEKIKKMFLEKNHKTFGKIIENKIPMQWWWLSDPFCPLEEQFWIWYELLQFFNEIEYPIRFSSKTDLFTRPEGKKYLDLLKQKPHLWFYMSSIITMDEEKAKLMEWDVPTPKKRFENLKVLSDLGIYTTLRLRPFIIWLSDKTLEQEFKMASESWIKAISTEFFCLERRMTDQLKNKFNKMSKIIWFDIIKFYEKVSSWSGYLRLNYEIKRKYIDIMTKLSEKYNIRFHCSDAQHKEKSMSGSCCWLPEDNEIFNKFNKCQFTNALMIAKQSKDYTVKFSDISKHDVFLKTIQWSNAEWLNQWNTRNRNFNKWKSLLDFMRMCWNNPNSAKSPYKYFGWILNPIWLDENKDIIYKLDLEKSNISNYCMWCWNCNK